MPFLEDQTEKSLKPDIPAPSSAQLLRGDGDRVERRVLVIMLCKQDPDTGCHSLVKQIFAQSSLKVSNTHSAHPRGADGLLVELTVT